MGYIGCQNTPACVFLVIEPNKVSGRQGCLLIVHGDTVKGGHEQIFEARMATITHTLRSFFLGETMCRVMVNPAVISNRACDKRVEYARRSCRLEDWRSKCNN